jgi:transcription elongation factor Elf1
MKRWEQQLQHRFVCPSCGAQNTRTVTVIQLSRSGDARCSHCGKDAPAKRFLPDPVDDDNGNGES